MLFQVWYQNDSVHVKAGDKIGLMKVNSTLPVPYISKPKMTANIWHSSNKEAALNSGEVLTFDEYGFPYHFSLTVTFRADRPNIYDILQRINTTELRGGPAAAKVTMDYQELHTKDLQNDVENVSNNISAEDIPTHKHVRYRYDNLPHMDLSTSEEEDYQDFMDITYASKITDTKKAENDRLSDENEISKHKSDNTPINLATSETPNNVDNTGVNTIAMPIIPSPKVASTPSTKVTTSYDVIMQNKNMIAGENSSINNTLRNMTVAAAADTDSNAADVKQSVLFEYDSQSEANASTSVTNGDAYDNAFEATFENNAVSQTKDVGAMETQYEAPSPNNTQAASTTSKHSASVVSTYEHLSNVIATTSSSTVASKVTASTFKKDASESESIATTTVASTTFASNVSPTAQMPKDISTAPFTISGDTPTSARGTLSHTDSLITSTSMYNPFTPSSSNPTTPKQYNAIKAKQNLSRNKKTKINSASEH